LVTETIVADLSSDLILVVAGSIDDRERAISAYSRYRVSRSAAAGRYAVLLARAGQVGLDVETVERVALNATSRDPWLAPAERALIDRAADPIVELACHWVLKEAYGKALGKGLDLPLDRLAFAARGGTIRLGGGAAPDPAGWSFALRRHGDLLVGIACRSDGDTVRAGGQETADAAAR
jgi:phosphopantetheinyl transferase